MKVSGSTGITGSYMTTIYSINVHNAYIVNTFVPEFLETLWKNDFFLHPQLSCVGSFVFEIALKTCLIQIIRKYYFNKTIVQRKLLIKLQSILWTTRERPAKQTVANPGNQENIVPMCKSGFRIRIRPDPYHFAGSGSIKLLKLSIRIR